MDTTDTQTRLETLERDLERNRPRIRIGWVAAVAAAAAVIAAVVLVDVRGDDRTGTPADSVDTQTAEDVASDFMAALAAYDAPRAKSHLALDARIELRTSTMDAASLAPHLRWTRAAGFRMLAARCDLESVAAPAATIACTFDGQGLGSERLGRGPFSDNVLRLTIVDGEIASGVEDSGSDGFFETTMWEPFNAWLVSHHADEAEIMYDDWPGWPLIRPALNDRSARLWAKNVDGYVRAVERGDAF